MLAQLIADPVPGLLLAQGAMPTYDGMYAVNLVARFLHIVASIILLGGLFYMRVVLAPRGRVAGGGVAGDAAASDAITSDPWFAGHRGKWAMWVGIASLLLIVTGLYNYLNIAKSYERMAASDHILAGIKMLLGLALLFLAALLAGRSGTAERFRQRMKVWLNVCLLIGLAVVALGSALRAYPHSPKAQTGPEFLVAPSDN